MARNGIRDIIEFFSSDCPVGVPEFIEFWKSLSDDEKDYYLSVKLY